MKTTIQKLRRIIRKVIQEHVGDEHHEHGTGSHKEEPYDDYVKDFAGGYYEEYQIEDYLEFGEEYGYSEDQLMEWWNAAGDVDYKTQRRNEMEDDLETGRIDLERNPYALD
jgi:hypothetical protein